ncbi:signal peptidase I [Puteibacter caeruleilacunae]|nr:signal peptidase I [Puteibacter caeruleilacunae]
MKRHLYITIPILAVVIVAFAGLPWLGLGIMIFTGLIALYNAKWKFMRFIRKSTWLSGLFFLKAAFVIAITIRLFFFEVFNIPSYSMDNTLKVGDVVMVNKLHYGPRLPQSPFEVPWVNILFYLNDDARVRINEQWWDYRRLPGFGEIQRNDVAVFNFPYDDKSFFIKRCIGLPGEEIKLVNNKVMIDNHNIQEAPKVKQQYDITYESAAELWSAFKEVNLGIDTTRLKAAQHHIKRFLNYEESCELENKEGIQSCVLIKDKRNSIENQSFDNSKLHWSYGNFGPLKIPSKGMSVQLTPENIAHYHRILKVFEGLEWSSKQECFLKNGKAVRSHSFEHDYYFMMGDNRTNSVDSRSWGLVPEIKIVGKAQLVIFSSYKGKFNWNRIAKKIL